MSEVVVPGPQHWMLVDRAHPSQSEPGSLRTRQVLTAVLRRSLPNVVEATVVPAVLFVAVTATFGSLAAMVVVLVWGYGAVARRLAFRQRVPGLLVLATVGLTARTVIGVASGSTFAYFAQPIGTTVVLALLFAGSALIGRPVIARLAHDFVPLHPDVAARPAVVQLFAGLTLLWAAVHVLTAAATLSLLVTLPVTWFVIIKTAATAGISVAAIAVTVRVALRTARREQLVFAPA